MHAVINHFMVRYGFLIGIIYALLFSSCLSEPDRDCPSEYQLRLSVQDKNYSNISDVPQILPKDETLPFSAYIGNLFYELKNVETQEVFATLPSSSVSSGGSEYLIHMNDIPDGRYVFTVLGNIDLTNVLKDNMIPLHENNEEHVDTYLVHDTVSFSSRKTEYDFSLHRTKGMVVVLLEGVPDSLMKVEERISNVGQFIDLTTDYSGESFVNKSFTKGQFQSGILSTLVAPTVSGKKSVLRLSLFGKDEVNPYAILPDVEFLAKRNAISFMKISFTSNGIEIWVNIAGSWQKSHDMALT